MKKFDMDNLSYKAYGNIVLICIVVLALLFNNIPFSSFKIYEIMVYISMIPIYLFIRNKFIEPIHAIGLNNCFVATMIFYILLFTLIRIGFVLLDITYIFIIATALNVIACYFTSTVPNKMDYKGKLFFGLKAEEGKYKLLYDFIKYNYDDPRLIKFEDYLKSRFSERYNIYKATFIDKETREELSLRLYDTDDLRKLYKELDIIYAMCEKDLDLK